MPVRDCAVFSEAIDSVLTQTGGGLELIVVDDASSDDTPRVLEQVRDERLRILRNDERRGIAGSLNRGLAIARGSYIARMDADDVALPHRLRTQREFLEANPRIALCGTYVRMFAGDWHRDVALETDPERMRCALLLFNVISHPTAMWRRDAFERHGLATTRPSRTRRTTTSGAAPATGRHRQTCRRCCCATACIPRRRGTTAACGCARGPGCAGGSSRGWARS